jgi:hypothetical protein
MQRQSVNDLLAFLAVARERSFTKAAARFGVSQRRGPYKMPSHPNYSW